MAKQSNSTPSKLVSPSSTASNLKWYTILTEFFHRAGLLETIRGFEADLLVLSRAQHERLPSAIQSLIDEVCMYVKDLFNCSWEYVRNQRRRIMRSYMLLYWEMILWRMLLPLNRFPISRWDLWKAKSKMKTFINRKRKLVNQSNQQEYTRKRQNTGEDSNGITRLNMSKF